MFAVLQKYLFGFFLAFTGLALPAIAQQGVLSFTESLVSEFSENVVAVRTVWSADLVSPGDKIVLALITDIKKGFHLNADADQIVALGDFKPYPTHLRLVETPEGITIDPPRYPKAESVRVEFADGDLMSFSDRIVIYIPVRIDTGLLPGIYTLTLELSYQACDDKTCLLPVKEKAKSVVRVVGPGVAATEINADVFSEFYTLSQPKDTDPVGFDLFGWRFSINASAGTGLMLLALTAAFGGMLLNFTPCVLPLVPIKIISLSKAGEQGRRRSILLGVSMSLGVLAFWLLIGVMIAMVSGFTATNQLFQYPVFTITIGVIIAAMAFGMCGVFHTRLPNFVYLINPDQESLPGSFALGILTAVLSTPCTAPFMGAAAAWAATRHPATTLLTFSAIGCGMALPYLILSIWPKLVRKMPRTGAGSVLLKEVMGLMMMAAAAYFIGSGLSAMHAQAPDPPSKIYWWAVMAFCAGAGGWLVFRIFHITSKIRARIVFTIIGLLLISGSVFAGLRLTHKGPIDWVNYTPLRFQKIQAQGNSIVMVFTAEWCLNCKAIEQSVFHSPRLVARLSTGDVIPMKVDITGNNPPGKAKLTEIGSLTIPLLAVFSPEGELVFKSDFYTVDQVLRAIDTSMGL